MEWTSPEVVSTMPRTYITIDPEEVRRLYWEEELSGLTVSKRLGVPRWSIYSTMQRNNIPRRSIAEALALVNGRTLTLDEVNKTHKFCPGCGEVKPINDFCLNASAYNGLANRCRECCKDFSQRATLRTGGKSHRGLHKRPFPLNGKCEICSIGLDKHYCYHHFNDDNLSLGIWVCCPCDYLAEGVDEVGRNSRKRDLYRRLKEEVEEAEKAYVYLGPFKPLNGIGKLYSPNGEQTHKWCAYCGRMLPINEFYKSFSHCKECIKSSRIDYRGGGERQRQTFSGLHKRPKPANCELCGSGTNLHYHHWDNSNKSKGVWICRSNDCHPLAEAVDLIDSGSLLPGKYYELKQGVILEDSNNTRLSTLESRVTILEAENVLVGKSGISEAQS